MRHDLGIIIARFQTHTLTEAHKYLIDQVATRCSRLAIFLGVSPVFGTKRNPMEPILRQRMVEEYLATRHPSKDTLVYPLQDCRDDENWVERVDSLISAISSGFEPTVYSGPDGAVDYYRRHSGKHQSTIIDGLNLHATEIRDSIIPRYTEDFRAGVVYACTKRFPACYPTVDVAIHYKDQLFMGQKLEDGDKLRFIGGFVDPTDDSLEAAASRELFEEAGITASPDEFEYLGSTKIDDWRYRSGPEKIISSLFLLNDYCFPTSQAGDDLHKVGWHLISEVEARIQAAHVPLLAMVLEKI